MFNSSYLNKRVLVTGHTGFKGSWLCTWLESLGASVSGYALAPQTTPNHFGCLEFAGESIIDDIRDYHNILRCVQEHQPEIIFHLAAQPSVLVSYDEPVETFATNILGTTHLLETVKNVSSVRAVVVVTSDKCYENKEWDYGYRESDLLGGHDPYSASKACTELVTESYRKSFFSEDSDTNALIASARAGNVIGGGDWTADRLLPDVARAADEGKAVMIRNPNSSRPWQHVLEPLSGYLRLGQLLLEGNCQFAQAWNFGPGLDANVTTSELVTVARKYWPNITAEFAQKSDAPHEAGLLMVDSTKARRLLDWSPVWDVNMSVQKTVEWYRTFYENDGSVLTVRQIDDYCRDAASMGSSWAREK